MIIDAIKKLEDVVAELGFRSELLASKYRESSTKGRADDGSSERARQLSADLEIEREKNLRAKSDIDTLISEMEGTLEMNEGS